MSHPSPHPHKATELLVDLARNDVRQVVQRFAPGPVPDVLTRELIRALLPHLMMSLGRPVPTLKAEAYGEPRGNERWFKVLAQEHDELAAVIRAHFPDEPEAGFPTTRETAFDTARRLLSRPPESGSSRQPPDTPLKPL